MIAVLATAASCSSSSPTTKSAPADDGGSSETVDAGSTSDDAAPGRDVSVAASVPDDGPNHCGGATLPDGGLCPKRMPGTTTIIGATYSATGSTITYGTAPDLWDVWAFASPGESAPTVTPNANSLSVSVTLTPRGSTPASAGVGVSVGGATCVSESNFASGLQFALSGELGGCALYLDSITSEDESATSDPCRGSCIGDSTACVAPNDAIDRMGMITVANMSLGGGQPGAAADTDELIGFRWRLQTPTATMGCTANITLSKVAFFGI